MKKWTDEHELGRLMEQRDQLRVENERLRAKNDDLTEAMTELSTRAANALAAVRGRIDLARDALEHARAFLGPGVRARDERAALLLEIDGALAAVAETHN